MRVPSGSALKLKEGDPIELSGTKFTVTTVLPETGTSTTPASLPTSHVQKIAGKESVLNAVEVSLLQGDIQWSRYRS